MKSLSFETAAKFWIKQLRYSRKRHVEKTNVSSKLINLNILILGVFTEKPNRKPLERNVVYIPITTPSRATSMTSI